MDAAQQFLSNISIYGRPAVGGGPVDLFAGGFTKDNLARFWLGQFAPFAIEQAREKASANRVLQSEGAIAAFEDQELQGAEAYGDLGGNPELFRRGQEQRRAQLRGQLTALGAQSRADFANDVFASLSGAAQQASNAVIRQKTLDQQRYIADRARKAIEKGRKRAKRAGYIQAAGAILSAVAPYAAPAVGAALGVSTATAQLGTSVLGAGLSGFGGAQGSAAGFGGATLGQQMQTGGLGSGFNWFQGQNSFSTPIGYQSAPLYPSSPQPYQLEV